MSFLDSYFESSKKDSHQTRCNNDDIRQMITRDERDMDRVDLTKEQKQEINARLGRLRKKVTD